MIIVTQSPDGSWSVIVNDVVVISGLTSNAEAWREAERLDLRPTWKTSANELRSGEGLVPPIAKRKKRRGRRRRK
jgi:hypothetical protein